MNPILIKLAVKLALEPDNLKKILKWIFISIFLLLLIPAIMLITISVLFGNGSIKGDFDLTKTEVFSQVNPIYEDYIKEITKEMNAEANRIIEENTTTDVDPETGEETSECDVNVEVTVNEPGLCVLLAYLSTVNFQENKAEKYKTDRGKILEFYRSVNRVGITNDGNDYLIQNVILSTEEIANLYFPDQTYQKFYLTSYGNFTALYKDDRQDTTNPGWGNSGYDGELVYGVNGMNIPLYKQGGGQPWSSMAYGNGTIASSGCAPTSLAMVISYLTGNRVTPADVVSWTGNRYYVSGQGSSWNIFPACASHWGISCQNLGKSTASMTAALSSGKPVIASVGPGTFTKGGHLIVLRGITEDGKILVNDPSDNDTKNHINKKFPLELIIRESKNFWSFH
ncbi:hypothetical protein C1H59_06580 [Clostridium sp. 3-3]|nr:hypothetical protein C1H59_06580 [Clostridium sp. 3-3]